MHDHSLSDSQPSKISNDAAGIKQAFIATFLSIPLLLGIGHNTSANTISESNPNNSARTATKSEQKDDVEILVIHSYHSNLSWTQALKTGIEQGFPSEVTIHHEYLDAKRHPELQHQTEFLAHIQTKYQDTDLSLLMVSDDPGLGLVLDSREEYFSEFPIVFMGINNVQDSLLDKPWLTGVFETHSNVETILEAAQHNNADTAIIVSDSTATGQGSLQRIQDRLTEGGESISLVVVEDLTTSEIPKKLDAYPDHWPIFLAGQLRDGHNEGALIAFEKEAQVLQAQIPNPIYTNSIMRLGFGAVGGKLLDGNYHAQQAVQLAQRILDGTPVSEIAPVLKAKNRWMFDAEVIAQADLDIDDFPPESIFINAQPSFYSQYRSLVWGSLTLFSFSILTITVLSYAISRQKKAERLLKENEQQLEKRVETRTAELSETLGKLQQTQAQLIQTEKMSSLGQLVGGVAHELNNPLSFFSGNITCIEKYCQDLFSLIQLYQQQSTPSPSILEYREEIDIAYIEEDIPHVFKSVRGGASRIQNIVSSLQAFSRADEVGSKLTDINQSIESTCKILNTQLSQDITIHKSYGTLPEIACNPGELNQVFLSILTNAIDAMKTERNHLKQIFISTLVHAEQSVRISIKDNGAGIPENIQGKVFDPFFTTKPIGTGTGLGLSLAYQTIKKHRGNILLCSDGENGTEFIIDLPIA